MVTPGLFLKLWAEYNPQPLSQSSISINNFLQGSCQEIYVGFAVGLYLGHTLQINQIFTFPLILIQEKNCT